MNQAEFASPGPEFRSVPLYGHVDEMRPEEVARQIAEIARQGFGGVVLTPFAGLESPPYLTSQWMDHVAFCAREAKRHGIRVILYDEDLYTSGYARGLVAAKDPDYRVKALVCREDRQYEPRRENLRVFLADKEGGGISNPAPLEGDPPEPGAGKVFLHFYQWTSAAGYQKRRWRWHGWTPYDGFEKVDLLNPDAVRAFLDTTHEAYAARLAEQFGQTVCGIFTDEPNLGSDVPFSVPWTPGFPAWFADRKGYDILDHLPALFYDVGEFRRVRYDFWSAVTDLFVESYSRQIGDWCAAHGLAATGHYWVEESLVLQATAGGAMMRHYEHQQIPGIDHLGQNIEHYGIAIKQIDSVACQLGRKRVLSETYACSSNNIGFEARKWIADWQFALGVNLLAPSFLTYSLRGYRKRNWSPILSWQQPWWPHSRLIEDYLARLSYALTRGLRVADILVIHPIASVWTELRPEGTWAASWYNGPLCVLTTGLLERHRDFHFGDEGIMSRHARVEGAKLRVGRMSYGVVIVPPALTLSAETVEVLQRFADAGGRIIAVEPVPTLIDARAADSVLPPSTDVIPADMALLERRLDEALPADVVFEGPNVLCHHRRTEGRDIYFLANTDDRNGWRGTVKLRTAGRLEEWDLHTGDVRALPARTRGDFLEVDLSLPVAGSRLLVVDRKAAPVKPPAPASAGIAREVSLSDTWTVERLSENALVLDYAQYSVADGGWTDPTPVGAVYESLRATCIGAPVRLRYSFHVEQKPEGNIHLAVERPEDHRILVNGEEVAHADLGHWMDIAFRRVDVSALVREGENVIELQTVFRNDTEIEPCYVLGDFAVRAPSVEAERELPGYREVSRFHAEAAALRITREHKTVRGGDLIGQGYPFFAGTIALSQEVDIPSDARGRALLELDGLAATVANVRVNGADVGAIAFHPHEIDITERLREGVNRIEVRLVNTLRNVIGPLHHRAGDLYFLLDIGDAYAGEANWSEAYQWVPLGLRRARIVWRA